ncbi:MAG: glycoside hydrolase family 15 protein [Desulfobulbales bacterium]|nr:glycoside hydrolase family 15 protein [Desulfobulbales bacterium]
MAYKKIGDYGIIGNGQTLALVGIDGSIDWMCLPYMDSPSVFGALLDERKGGCFRIGPGEEWDSVQKYLARTNILRTSFRTGSGEFDLLDFMPVYALAEKDPASQTMLNRCLKGKSGRVKIEVEFSPRFRYGLGTPAWRKLGASHWLLSDGAEAISLFISTDCDQRQDTLSFALEEGQTVWLSSVYGGGEPPEAAYLEELFEQTKRYWLDWVDARETGKYPHLGYWQDDLDRTALVLKLLQFKETGAIAAAATTSLPTIIHGRRNWDYRFSWVRDTSMTLQALFELGHIGEVSAYLDWIKKLGRRNGGHDLEILYRLREPEPPGGERELEHLAGYKGSRPVRIGQYVVDQKQHDIYGELLDMNFSMSRLVGKIDPDYWDFVRHLVDKVCEIWPDRDDGIWEQRTGPRHFTHSKVMCWVALDRGIKIADHYGFPADLDKWRRERDRVHADVLEKGYNRSRRCFTQHYGSEEVDAALLQIPLVGFLPVDDPRVAGTIEAVERDLMLDGIPMRYRADDGLPGQEPGWLICLFWYLRCLIRQGRLAEVEDRLRRVGRYANHLGLLGEEYDPDYQEITGNFPQAFSHIGYAMTVLEYLEARRQREPVEPLSLKEKARLLIRGRNLTPAIPPSETAGVANPGREIKKIMNLLRGQFYDGHRQRIDYQSISASEHYRKFEKTVASLRHFAPDSLADDPARIAFWTNVFNTLVIHGVIVLKIGESVKEVPFFFERVKYTIGKESYSLSDIEHGILRGNKAPPYRFRRRFSGRDPRLAFRVSKPDPRVHFALVCASRTCPPIEAYEEEKIAAQLDTSARVFINATSRLKKAEGKLCISQIFRWYRADFGLSTPGLLRFIGDYFYDRQAAEWIGRHSDSLAVEYTPYDWRLNR